MAGISLPGIIFIILVSEPIQVVVIGGRPDAVGVIACIIRRRPVPGGICPAGGEIVMLLCLYIHIGRPPLAEIRHWVGGGGVLEQIPVGSRFIYEIEATVKGHLLRCLVCGAEI